MEMETEILDGLSVFLFSCSETENDFGIFIGQTITKNKK